MRRTSARCKAVIYTLALIQALVAPLSVWAQADIVWLEGAAEVFSPETRDWKRIGATPFHLENGSRLRSGSKTSVDIRFADGSRIRLGPSSVFTLNTAHASASEMTLELGELRAWVHKQLSRRAFRVTTPVAVMAVRGTQFVIKVDDSKETTVEVSEGVVSVRTLLGEEVDLGDGMPLRFLRILPDQPLNYNERGPARREQKGVLFATHAEMMGEGQKEEFRKDVRREVALGLTREGVQAAAAVEARRAEYIEGKTMLDASGRRVRLEEYVVRPAADSFKLVSLNARSDSLNYFYYQAQFNQTLPADLTQATRYLSGKDGAPPDFFVLAYETGRSNTIDSIQEFATAGHLVNTTLTQDRTIYDGSLNAYRTVTTGSSFWETLFDNYSYRVNGTEKFGWQPAAGSNITSYNYGAGGINTRIWNGSTGGVANPMVVCTSLVCEQAARIGTTSSPDGAQILHDQASITYAADGSKETYDFYVVGDGGQVASVADFAGVTGGLSYQNTLLKYSYEQKISETEFNGRTIDFIVEPRILVKAGLLP